MPCKTSSGSPLSEGAVILRSQEACHALSNGDSNRRVWGLLGESEELVDEKDGASVFCGCQFLLAPTLVHSYVTHEFHALR